MAALPGKSNRKTERKIEHVCLAFDSIEGNAGSYEFCESLSNIKADSKALIPGARIKFSAIEEAGFVSALIYCKAKDIRDFIQQAAGDQSVSSTLLLGISHLHDEDRLYFFARDADHGKIGPMRRRQTRQVNGQTRVQLRLPPEALNMCVDYEQVSKWEQSPDVRTPANRHSDKIDAKLTAKVAVPSTPTAVGPNLQNQGPSKMLPRLASRSVPQNLANKPLGYSKGRQQRNVPVFAAPAAVGPNLQNQGSSKMLPRLASRSVPQNLAIKAPGIIKESQQRNVPVPAPQAAVVPNLHEGPSKISRNPTPEDVGTPQHVPAIKALGNVKESQQRNVPVPAAVVPNLHKGPAISRSPISENVRPSRISRHPTPEDVGTPLQVSDDNSDKINAKHPERAPVLAALADGNAILERTGLRLPAVPAHLRPLYAHYSEHHPYGFSGYSHSLPNSFCSGQINIQFIDEYVNLLRRDTPKRPATLFANAFNCTTANTSGKSLILLEQLFGSAVKASGEQRPTQIFLPCWTASHCSLLVIRPEAQPKTLIEVWDPVRGDPFFNRNENHDVIKPLIQLFEAAVVFEPTHIAKLPYTFEKHASGYFMLDVMERLSRCREADEEFDMRQLIGQEASQNSDWESQYLQRLQQNLFWEVFIGARLLYSGGQKP